MALGCLVSGQGCQVGSRACSLRCAQLPSEVAVVSSGFLVEETEAGGGGHGRCRLLAVPALALRLSPLAAWLVLGLLPSLCVLLCPISFAGSGLLPS